MATMTQDQRSNVHVVLVTDQMPLPSLQLARLSQVRGPGGAAAVAGTCFGKEGHIYDAVLIMWTPCHLCRMQSAQAPVCVLRCCTVVLQPMKPQVCKIRLTLLQLLLLWSNCQCAWSSLVRDHLQQPNCLQSPSCLRMFQAQMSSIT